MGVDVDVDVNRGRQKWQGWGRGRELDTAMFHRVMDFHNGWTTALCAMIGRTP